MTQPKREKIMVVDDEAEVRNALVQLLEMNWDVVQCSSAEEALHVVHEQPINLVLTDINMGGMTGLQLLAALREDARTKLTPVILVSGVDDARSMVEAFQNGASDYVTKPFNAPVLLARIDSHLREAALRVRLEMQNSLLAKLAAFDELTGVYNRRSMMDALEAEVTRSVRYGHALTVLMLDLDRFKDINDSLGHLAGDQVLKGFAARCASILRSTDILCRYGGEEFCVIMPETDQQNGSSAAERIRSAVSGDAFEVEGRRVDLTVSIGLACLPKEFQGPPEQLVKEADSALYEAKRMGRDQVRVYNAENCQVGD